MSLTLRIDLDPGGRVGSGKIALLEQIDATGSISAAARAVGMSYKRAWDLVEESNRIFRKTLVATQAGGKRGGGAELTEAGHAIVKHYRAIEKAARKAAARHLKALEAEIGQV